MSTGLEGPDDSNGKATACKENIDLSTVRDVLRAVITEMYSPLENQMAEVAKCISVLRWISAELVSYVVEKQDKKKISHGDAYYLDQIAILQSNHFLYWNAMQKNYEFDPVLRNLLTHFLEMDDPKLFHRVNRNAFAFHLEHLERYPQYLARYVPELAYHHALLERYPSQEYSLVNFSKWWIQFQETRLTGLSGAAWKELLERLESDDELRKLSPIEYDILLSDTQYRIASQTE